MAALEGHSTRASSATSFTKPGNNIAMDSYGPITDNANGIGEMAWHDLTDEETKKGRQIIADLDAMSNTTKAITKGVAIASLIIAPIIVAAKSTPITWMVAALLIAFAAWALRRSQHEIALEEEMVAQRPDLADQA